MREALIVLTPKPGKDPSLPESYHPISLLQVDVKILILATRLNKVILSLIHENQSGLIPGMNTSFKLGRLFINFQIPHDNIGLYIGQSIQLGWVALSMELSGKIWLGFGPYPLSGFIKWVKLLYQAPVARVLVNGWSSEQFHLTRSTWQGCPISPLLYTLGAEPLAITICSHLNIVGLKVGHLIEKFSTYVDNTLLYLDDSTKTLPTLALIECFAYFSGLKINWDTSQILVLGSCSPSQVQANLSLQMVDQIQISWSKKTCVPADYVPLNINPLFEMFKNKTQLWAQLPIGVMGCIHFVKMVQLSWSGTPQCI